jgi:solute carrier family 12 sodium/potassium/chloride transporter 2
MLVEHETAGLGRRRRINLWLPDQGPEWRLEMEFADLDLAVLLAYRMLDSWDGHLTVIATIREASERPDAERFVNRLVGLARLPADVRIETTDPGFEEFARDSPPADLQIFPLPGDFEAGDLWRLRDAAGSTCLFTQDGGDESALA